MVIAIIISVAALMGLLGAGYVIIASFSSKGEKLRKKKVKKMFYFYGMRLRGFSIGTQPNGVIQRLDDETGKYHDIIVYERKLTPEQEKEYELDYIKASEMLI